MQYCIYQFLKKDKFYIFLLLYKNFNLPSKDINSLIGPIINIGIFVYFFKISWYQGHLAYIMYLEVYSDR